MTEQRGTTVDNHLNDQPYTAEDWRAYAIALANWRSRQLASSYRAESDRISLEHRLSVALRDRDRFERFSNDAERRAIRYASQLGSTERSLEFANDQVRYYRELSAVFGCLLLIAIAGLLSIGLRAWL